MGRVFVGRYLLDATSFEDAQHRLTEYSFNAGHNHQLMDLKTGKLIDLEVAPFWSVCNCLLFLMNSMEYLWLFLEDLIGMRIHTTL